MKLTDLQRRKARAQLARHGEWARLEVEFVTDDILQVMLYVDVTEKRESEAAWLLALAVDVVALEFDKASPPGFMSFVYSFGAAWSQVMMRPTGRRKKAADIGHLPSFLGGSEEPPGE